MAIFEILSMIINNYQFGEIIIDGKTYHNQDIIIYSEKVEIWLCSNHHHPSLADFNEILKNKPQILIIGTGYSGLAKVEKEVKRELKKVIPKIFILDTRRASQFYNKLASQNKNIVACFHLTC